MKTFYSALTCPPPPKHRPACLFDAVLCKPPLQYIKYSCGRLALPAAKNPAQAGAFPAAEQVYRRKKKVERQFICKALKKPVQLNPLHSFFYFTIIHFKCQGKLYNLTLFHNISYFYM